MTYRGAPGTADPAKALRQMPQRVRVATQAPLIAVMLEGELQKNIIDMAVSLGCRVNAQRPALTTKGRWITATQGHKGWLDLTIVGKRKGLHGQPVLFRELKSMRGTVTPEQREWIKAWLVAGYDAAVWTPEHWFSGQIETELRRIA